MNNQSESIKGISDIEARLESLLADRVGEIDKDLEERIRREREAALARKEGIEKEFESERESLLEFKSMVRDSEAERKAVLDEVRERFDQILQYQAEIENLAKATGEEIKKVGELQQALHEIRGKTADKAASIRKELQDRFGITAEIAQDEDPVVLDLDRELERLKQIKNILAGGPSATFPPAAPSGPAAGGLGDAEIPEISELIAGEAPAENSEKADDGPAPVPEPAAEKADPPSAREASVLPNAPEGSFLAGILASLRKYEPDNGGGEISYFQKDGPAVLDAEELFHKIGTVVAEARTLSSRLLQVESPKEQFFLKQELLNCQEVLRSGVLKIVRLCEKSGWALPDFTIGILNVDSLREMLEKLNMGNWSDPSDFVGFDGRFTGLAARFDKQLESRLDYLRSIMSALETA